MDIVDVWWVYTAVAAVIIAIHAWKQRAMVLRSLHSVVAVCVALLVVLGPIGVVLFEMVTQPTPTLPTPEALALLGSFALGCAWPVYILKSGVWDWIWDRVLRMNDIDDKDCEVPCNGPYN